MPTDTDMEADEAARTGAQLGRSYEIVFEFDEGPRVRQAVESRKKWPRRKPNKPKPTKHSQNTTPKGGLALALEGVEVGKWRTVDEDPNSLSDGFASVTVSSVDSKEAKAAIVKTGKPNHHQKSSSQFHLGSLTDDRVDGPLYNSGDQVFSRKKLEPAALELERQVSGSHDYLDCLDLSNARFNLEENDIKITNRIGKVNLDHNRLHEMPLKYLKLPKLKSISMASNLIKSVELPPFVRLQHLAILELPSNKLKKFPSADTLERLPQLRSLILYNNNITDVPYRSVEKLISLGKIEEINLSYNMLSSLPRQIGLLTSLTTLRLANNNLQSLPETITGLCKISDFNFEIEGNRLSCPPQKVAARGLSAVVRFFKVLQQEENYKNALKAKNDASSTCVHIPSTESSVPQLGQALPVSAREGGVFLDGLSPMNYDESGNDNGIKSNQFKMIVVGHEAVGKSSCIRCLTRTLVYIKPIKRYGRLLGPHGPHLYKVELMCFSDENSDSTSSFTLRDDEAASRNDATDSDNNVVYCKIYDVELVEDINSGGQNPGVIEAVKEMKPQSTVGIDIDIWRPAMASDFKTRYREHQAELVKVAAKGESTSQLQRADKDLNGEDYCSSFDEVNRFSLLKFDDEDVSPKQSFISPDDIPPSPAPARDLVLSIWDFAGQEIYHAAQEAFFSEQSLYIVVWNMTMNSESEMDLCVQFWIDLIQSRAPGSIIVIVATHADKFAKKSPRRRNSKSTCKIDSDNHIQDRSQWTPTALCQRLSQHLKSRESFRKEVLTKNIAEAIDEGNGEELKHLKVLRRNRPKIFPIYPVSCTTMSGFDDLTEKIINLSTPTKKNKHPFQVDVPITRCFDRVKRVIRSLRHSGNNVVTVKQLHSQLLKTETPLAFKKDSLAAQLSQHSLSEVQDAISFLSGIGEVVWFPRSTTHKKVRMEKVDGVTVTQTAMSSSLLDSIPQMGNRGRSCSSASSGTACSIDEWDEMTWREVDEVHAGRDNDSDADNVSHVVFLNPHWLMDVLKRVLTHNLIDDFRTLATRFDPIEEKKYFGESHSDHTKNGIVRWNLIEDHLIRLDNNFLIDNDKNVVTALRSLMEKFNIIIPLTMYAGDSNGNKSEEKNVNSKISSGGDRPTTSCASTQDSSEASNGCSDYFLIPALVEETEKLDVPTVAPRGSIKLETVFRLENFLPPGLLQRIMSQTFFQYGNNISERQKEYYLKSGEEKSYQCSAKNYCKSSFLQTFESRQGEISVWVWIEKGACTTHEIGTASKSDGLKTDIDGSRLVEIRGTVHISVTGNILLVQDLVKKLNFYSEVVADILSPHRALCHVSQMMVCPGCSMKERTLNNCGEFSLAEIADLDNELNEISRQKLNHNSSSSQSVSFEWMKRCRRRCSRHTCLVNPEHLTVIPSILYDDTAIRTDLEKSEATINFLMEEVIRLSSKPTVEIMNSVCKVGVGFCAQGKWDIAKRDIASGGGHVMGLNLVFPFNPLLASGAILNINPCDSHIGSDFDDVLGDDSFVVTCEHFIGDPVDKEKSLLKNDFDLDPVFLIGDQDHWLYVAELVMQGSDYPNGRDRFSVPMDVDGARYAGISHPSSSSGCTPEFSFDHVTLEDLKDLTAPSNVNCNQFQQPSNSNEPGSSDRKHSSSNECGERSVLEFSTQKNGCWDVAVFKVICKIKPTDKGWITFDTPIHHTQGELKSTFDDLKNGRVSKIAKSSSPDSAFIDLFPMRGSAKVPEVEQTMRLISYQGMPRSPSGTISVCWGNINMILHKQLLINFYSDFGSSGGAVVDCEGNLVGLLSNSIMKVKPTAYVEPIYPLLNLLRSGKIWKQGQ